MNENGDEGDDSDDQYGDEGNEGVNMVVDEDTFEGDDDEGDEDDKDVELSGQTSWHSSASVYKGQGE